VIRRTLIAASHDLPAVCVSPSRPFYPHLNSGGISASQNQEQVLLCYMNHHDGIEPYKFSLSLRNNVIEIVLLYRRQDGCVYCVTELVGLLPLRQLGE
jgi:hypothetical protein